jgi:NAD-specific glutamate dehydrogenase
MTEIVLGIISAISVIIAGLFKYREVKLQKEHDLKQAQLTLVETNRASIVDTMMGRVDKLEARQDLLQDKIYEVGKKATDEREMLIKANEEKLEAVRKEMRRLIDDSNLELATWRDRYFTLMEEYRVLKVEYNALDCRFKEMENEVNKLRAIYYKRRKDDTLDDMIEDPDFIA